MLVGLARRLRTVLRRPPARRLMDRVTGTLLGSGSPPAATDLAEPSGRGDNYAAMVIKGLLLDFYGTVVEDDDAIMQAIADQVAAGASTSVAGREVMDVWAREYEAVATGPQFRTLRHCAMRSLARVMAEVGCAGDPAELCAAQFTYWRSPPLRPGTREFLSRVTVPICVVSDVDRADLDAAMAHHGLTFTAVVTSEDVRAYKPDRDMFTRALAALNLGADDVLHVGDSTSADVYGAHAAGIQAVWINHRGHTRPDDTPVAHEMTDLTRLIEILQ